MKPQRLCHSFLHLGIACTEHKKIEITAWTKMDVFGSRGPTFVHAAYCQKICSENNDNNNNKTTTTTTTTTKQQQQQQQNNNNNNNKQTASSRSEYVPNIPEELGIIPCPSTSVCLCLFLSLHTSLDKQNKLSSKEIKQQRYCTFPAHVLRRNVIAS